jgi:tRNA (guanine37-N1)-methyltransferase
MVMKAEVWGEALDEIAPPAPEDGPAGVPVAHPAPRLIVPTPSGVPFTQARAVRYTEADQLIFACGRYEGIDARFIDEARSRMPVDEVSIGDYVLAGGEAAVLVMVEAISRLLPGVLGNERSASDDSFGGRAAMEEDLPSEPGGALVPDLGGFGRGRGDAAASMAGLLEGPVYTRPRVWRGREVPDVLLSGDHAAIARWRRDAALLRTAANRPDLIFRAQADPAALSDRDWQVLTAMGLSDVLRSAGPGPEEAARLPEWSRNMAH